MIDLSLNEVEALAAKVGRASGYSWGLAEELARGARALAQGGFPWAEALLALARDGARFRAPTPADLDAWRAGRSASGAAAPLCPLRTAAMLNDDPSLARVAPLTIGVVGLPLWIAALLAPCEGESELTLAWPGASLAVTRRGLAGVTPDGEWLRATGAATIVSRARGGAPTPLHRRAAIAESALAALAAIAAQVYVPASEHSRARGAGGGSVDAD